MGNVIRGEARVEHAGETLHLVLDMNAFTVAGRMLDMGINRLMAEFEASKDDPKLHIIQAILYGSLNRHHPDISPAMTMDLVQEIGTLEISKVLEELCTNAMPKADEGNEVAPKGADTASQKPSSGKKKTRSGGKKKP